MADVLERVGRIPQDILSGITRSVLQGLAYLHANHTVHRDIKPANILMSISGEPKVSDFGISAFVDNTIAQCHTFLGTVTYMSPERINGQPYAFPADIWSLGLALVECATGRYPYDASGGTMQLMIHLMEDECPLPPVVVVSSQSDTEGGEKEQAQAAQVQLTPEFRDFVTLCMAKDPMRRPTAEDLLRHPFISAAAPVDLRAFMRCMYNRDEKVADCVAIVTSRFYNNLAFNWVDEDSIAAFYGPETALVSGAAGTPETALQRIKGRYTVAAHFHEIMEQIGGGGGGGDVVFDLQRQKHRSSSSSNSTAAAGGDEGEVLITQRVVIKDEGHRSGVGSDESDVVVGVYDESMLVRLKDVDALVPGVGFVILAQQLRWVQPLVPRKSTGGGKESSSSYGMRMGGGMATPPKCRQQ